MSDNMVSTPRRRPGAIPAVLMAFGFAACESPQPPAPCGAAPQVTVHARESASVTACFNDPNGDVLSYSATSSNSTVATASASGPNITVAAVLPGSAAVTVTATDPGGLQGQQTFQVMVPNRAPEPRGTMPPMTVVAGQLGTVDAAAYFTEPDGQPLTYSAMSSNGTTATVTMAGSTVTVTAIAKGTTTVSVTARDPAGLTAQQAFQVTVPNRAPVAVGSIADIEVEMDTIADVNVAEHFADPDGDPLTYAASSSSPAHASVSVSGSVVTVSGVLIGAAMVTVTARDPEGLTARQTFRVKILNPDRRVLLVLYNSLGGSRWTSNTNWMTDAPLDAWYGVTTNEIGRVVLLDLRDNGLTGEIPAVVGKLRFLEQLDLAMNRVDESPPVFVGNGDGRGATAMRRDPVAVVAASSPAADRILSDGITGRIPPELANLSNLKELWLAENSLAGPIPPELGNLTNLESLWIRSNFLTGSIPKELANLSRLDFLNLSDNLLTGTIPRGLTDLSRLTVLWLGYNSLTGPIPQGLENLSNLEHLGLGYNSLTGPVPRELGSLSDLKEIWFSSNSLTGSIPRELADLDNLEELFLYDNDLTGTIPRELGDLSRLRYLSLPLNRLSGGIPPKLGNLASLEYLWLYGNELTGSLPPELGRVKGLKHLYVSANQLRGEVPYTFLDLEDLTRFWFGENSGLCAPAANAFTTWLNRMDGWFGPRCRNREVFDLEMWFTSDVSSTVRSHMEKARAKWAAVLRETELSDVTFNRRVECGGLYGDVGTVDDHLFWVDVDSIDGEGGTLAYAGYCWSRGSDDSPILSRAVFDEDDIDRMLDNDALVAVAFHELAHALGFSGYHWDKFDLIDKGSDAHFKGKLAIAAFNDAGGDDYNGKKVPVQLRVYSHWRENVFRDEVMSPTINLRSDDAPISAITLQSMDAIGYEVDASLADDYELPDPNLPPPAPPREDDPAIFDLGDDVAWGPVTVVATDGRVIRVIPPPPGSVRWPFSRREVRIEARRPPAPRGRSK